MSVCVHVLLTRIGTCTEDVDRTVAEDGLVSAKLRRAIRRLSHGDLPLLIDRYSWRTDDLRHVRDYWSLLVQITGIWMRDYWRPGITGSEGKQNRK